MTTLYAIAEAELNGRDRRNLERNTYLERIGADTIGVLYHETFVMRITPKAVVLDSDGWHTKTTWERMSRYGIRVAGGKSGVVVLLIGETGESGGHPYYDGIRLTADGTKLTTDQPALRPMMDDVRTQSGWQL